VPAPFVVELDHDEMGPALQALLLKNTGRRTVPNVLINGRSIGGGDDVAALHEAGVLVDKVRTMGGKRIMEARLS
jgi:glutaredoxin